MMLFFDPRKCLPNVLFLIFMMLIASVWVRAVSRSVLMNSLKLFDFFQEVNLWKNKRNKIWCRSVVSLREFHGRREHSAAASGRSGVQEKGAPGSRWCVSETENRWSENSWIWPPGVVRTPAEKIYFCWTGNGDVVRLSVLMKYRIHGMGMFYTCSCQQKDFSIRKIRNIEGDGFNKRRCVFFP